MSVTNFIKKNVKIIFVYMIVLHLFSVLLIIKTDFIPKLKSKIEFSAPASLYHTMIKFHQWMDDSVPVNAIIFLGDSITQGLATAAVAPYTINYGIGGLGTEELLDALASYKSLHRASAIVLMIGVNDLQYNKVGLSERYAKILDALPQDIPLIWNGVMPAKHNNINMSDIIDANREIQKLCLARRGCTFIDTSLFLVGNNGQIIESKFLSDGTHLSRKGYESWISELQMALKMLPL